MQRYNENEDFTQREMAALIYKKLEEYWNIIDSSSVTSAILDPRNKLSVFSRESIQDARMNIQAVFDIYQEQVPSMTTILSALTVNTTHQYFAQLWQ